MKFNDNIEIAKISLNRDLWIALIPDKLLFGGSFMPKHTHVTLSFGHRSKVIDLHMAKEMEQGVKIYAPLYRVAHHHLEKISETLTLNLAQIFFRILEEVNLEELSGAGAIFVPWKDSDPEHDKAVLDTIKPLLMPLVSRRKRAQYGITIDEARRKEIEESLEAMGLSKLSPYLSWLRRNAYDPKDVPKLDATSGMLFVKGELYLLYAVPHPSGTVRYYRLRGTRYQEEVERVKESLLSSSVGRAIVDHWKEAVRRLEMATGPSDMADFHPLTLVPTDT